MSGYEPITSLHSNYLAVLKQRSGNYSSLLWFNFNRPLSIDRRSKSWFKGSIERSLVVSYPYHLLTLFSHWTVMLYSTQLTIVLNMNNSSFKNKFCSSYLHADAVIVRIAKMPRKTKKTIAAIFNPADKLKLKVPNRTFYNKLHANIDQAYKMKDFLSNQLERKFEVFKQICR